MISVKKNEKVNFKKKESQKLEFKEGEQSKSSESNSQDRARCKAK